MLSVPLAGDAQVFSAQVVRAACAKFGIGSGVPKLHPVLVQSGAVLLSGGVVEVGPMVQIEPAQAPSQAPPAWQTSENRLFEPSGVGPSETTELPPPMFRPPQVRFLMRALAAVRVLPQVPPGVPVVNSRNAPPTAMIVVVVVELVVVEVEVVEVLVVAAVVLVVVVVEVLVVVVVVLVVEVVVVLVVAVVVLVVEVVEVLVVAVVVLVVEVVEVLVVAAVVLVVELPVVLVVEVVEVLVVA